MGEVKSAAEAGDLAAASSAFAGDAHTVTHEIAAPPRSVDPLPAQDLCASIVIIDQQFGTNSDTRAVAAQAEVAAGLLEESARVVGLRP